MNDFQIPVNIQTYQIIGPRLQVYYPRIMGLRNPDIERKINTSIQREVYQLMRDQGYYSDTPEEMTGSYEIKNNERGIFSLTLSNDVYKGGVHGLTVMRGLTFDVTKGEKYELKELFKPSSHYVEELSKIIRKQIEERDIYILGEFENIRPNQDYYIADKTLVIFFQLYELTAYAFGFPYFPISLYEIKSLIDEKGPLSRMLY